MNKAYKSVLSDKLKAGMVLGENIYDKEGNILLSEGIILKDSYIKKIQNLNIDKINIRVFNLESVSHNSNIDYIKTYEDIEFLSHKTKLEAKEIIKTTMEKISFKTSEIETEKIMIVVNKIVEDLLTNDSILMNLDRLRNVDDYTFEHSVNVCVLALVLGIKLGYNKEDLVELGIGAILHDIGKMLIPNEILNKPGPLTHEEYEIVKNHTTYGYDVLKKNSNISLVAAEVALCHHERPDGNGYPKGVKSNKIHTYSKIVAISDVYDALTSNRVYKNKIEPVKALEYIVSMSGTQFDSDLVYKFIECVGIYPLGSLVELNTKEVGIVIGINKKYPEKPVIRVLVDSFGNKISDHFEVDTSKNLDVEILSIIKSNILS